MLLTEPTLELPVSTTLQAHIIDLLTDTSVRQLTPKSRMNLQQSQGRNHSLNDCNNSAHVAELSLTSGAEWIVDANGCEPTALTACDVIRAVCEAVIHDLNLSVVGQPQWHAFPGPGGVTGLYLLSESHLACHTYPEFGLATFNLYCCREHGSWDWSAQLRNRLRATDVVIHKVRRGMHHAESATGGEGP